MASNTTGERRWAATKKGGMTVLGKVAVPKPINLPSQRLENHGLDPNIEIVPKGSLSWGARSSSSGSNPWGSSALSPNTEGCSASPSHLSGRPSSGGGTRPSTAGSERTPDSMSSVWTSNSRPSSASGILASSNTLMALRPRSAETRPVSSQLSRFAEPLPECTVAQVAPGSADQMGIAASSNDGFSLSSGDFPTLGSEKNSGKNLDHNYNDRPGSSSGLPSATTEKMEGAPDDFCRPTDVKSGMVNYWRNDGPQHGEDGCHPGMEKWHGDPYSYPNPNNSPQFYENWRGGAPLNPPSGGWFRGPPGAPYGAPPMPAPGGFPMEPFPYYRPQVPAHGAVNSQTVPPHSSGPRGPNSKSGDLCKPIVEPYIHPGMPIRPGFYPGYYGPPMGFWNPNERDYTFMGVSAGLPVYNRYPNQNVPESTNSNVISYEGRSLEQVEHGPPHDSLRCYSVPVKQNKGRDKNIEEEHWGHQVAANAHPGDKGNALNSSQENLWSEDNRKNEHMNHQTVSLQREEAASVLLEDKIDAKDPSYLKFHGSSSRGESVNMKPVAENVVLPRDHRLMKKIDSSNAKSQVSDRRHNFHKEESYDRGHVVHSNASHPINGSNTGIHLERHYPSGILVPVASNMTMLVEDKGFGSTTGSVATISRHSSHNLQGSGDNGCNSRFNWQEADGWQKKGATSESPGIVLVVNSERTANIQGQQQPTAMQSTEMLLSDGEMMDDSCDSQRAKMREKANQRAMKLQKEEEERIIEQKAKAFAKLEELNRRTANQSKETRDKTDHVPYHANVMQKQEDSNIKIELQFGSIQSAEMACTLAHGCNPSKASKAVESNLSSGVLCSQTDQHAHQDDPVPAADDGCINDVAGSQNVQVCQISRQKRAGYKQEYNVRSGKNLTEKPILEAKDKSETLFTVLKEAGEKEVSSSSESNTPIDLPIVADSLVQTKRKSTRVGKNKHKVDESFSVSSISVQKESNASKSVTESIKLDAIESKLEPLTVKPSVGSEAISPSLGINQSLSCDDAQYRGNSSLNHQHARNMPRHPQARSVEKSYSNDAVVWAPVKSQNKTETPDGNDQKAEGATAVPSTRSVNTVPSSSKGKRAEMERYVPKVAIKEPAQQGSGRLSASSTDQSIPDGMSSREQTSSQTIERTGRRVEPRHAGGKPNQKQTDGSGNQSSFMMNHTKNSQTFDELQQTRKLEELPIGSVAKPSAQLVKVRSAKQDEEPARKQSQQPGEINQDIIVDGWNIVEEPVSSGIVSGAKDQGTFGRGKRNSFKEHRGTRKQQNFDHKNHSCAEAYADYSEICQADVPNSSKGKNVAQWQPKSQTNVTIQQGSGASGQQTVTGEGKKIIQREVSLDGGSHLKRHNNRDTAKSIVLPKVHSLPESKDVSSMRDMGSQGSLVGRKAAYSKDHANSSNKDTMVEVESAPVRHTSVTKTEQRPSSSGHRKNGTHNGRFSRGHEFRGDPSFIAQDTRQNYAPTNWERQNSQYEFRPVGRYSTNKRGNNSEGQSVNQPAGPKFRDQGPGSHSRHGGASFYGQ